MDKDFTLRSASSNQGSAINWLALPPTQNFVQDIQNCTPLCACLQQLNNEPSTCRYYVTENML